MLCTFANKKPIADPSCFIADDARIIGDVVIGAESSTWFGAVIRGDDNAIRIGDRTNIQDLCVLHVDLDASLTIGDDVTVGHGSILHGGTIGSRVLIGMGAIVMNGAVIGEECVIGAGALLPEGMQVPPRSLVLGIPGRITRALKPEEIAAIERSAKHYVKRSREYLVAGRPVR